MREFVEINKDIFTVLSRKRQAWVVYGNFEDKFFFLKMVQATKCCEETLILVSDYNGLDH